MTPDDSEPSTTDGEDAAESPDDTGGQRRDPETGQFLPKEDTGDEDSSTDENEALSSGDEDRGPTSGGDGDRTPTTSAESQPKPSDDQPPYRQTGPSRGKRVSEGGPAGGHAHAPRRGVSQPPARQPPRPRGEKPVQRSGSPGQQHVQPQSPDERRAPPSGSESQPPRAPARPFRSGTELPRSQEQPPRRGDPQPHPRARQGQVSGPSGSAPLPGGQQGPPSTKRRPRSGTGQSRVPRQGEPDSTGRLQTGEIPQGQPGPAPSQSGTSRGGPSPSPQPNRASDMASPAPTGQQYLQDTGRPPSGGQPQSAQGFQPGGQTRPGQQVQSAQQPQSGWQAQPGRRAQPQGSLRNEGGQPAAQPQSGWQKHGSQATEKQRSSRAAQSQRRSQAPPQHDPQAPQWFGSQRPPESGGPHGTPPGNTESQQPPSGRTAGSEQPIRPPVQLSAERQSRHGWPE